MCNGKITSLTTIICYIIGSAVLVSFPKVRDLKVPSSQFIKERVSELNGGPSTYFASQLLIVKFPQIFRTRVTKVCQISTRGSTEDMTMRTSNVVTKSRWQEILPLGLFSDTRQAIKKISDCDTAIGKAKGDYPIIIPKLLLQYKTMTPQKSILLFSEHHRNTDNSMV